MVYLKDMERKLLQKSSERDISLYRFLHGQKHSLHVAKNDIESELCFNAFVDGGGDFPLTKLKMVKPFKGFHYTNNFVLLIAAAKVDANGEKNNIKNYLSSHGAKEQIIINSALGTSYRVATKLDTPIDILANLVEENKNIDEEDIQNCLSCISDIYDYFILEKGISRIIFQSNEKNNFKTYKSVVSLQKVALRRVEIGAFVLLSSVFSYLIYLTVPTTVGLVVNNWDTLEPISYIVDKVIFFVFIVTGVVLTTLVKSIKNRIVRFILHKVYWILGVDHSEYKKLTDIIESE